MPIFSRTLRAMTAATMTGTVIATCSPTALADPSSEAQLASLTRQVESTTEALYTAGATYRQKIAEREAASRTAIAAREEADRATAEMIRNREAVNRLAVATYTGMGPGLDIDSIFTATGPADFLEKATIKKIVGDGLAITSRKYRESSAAATKAADAAATAEKTAVDAANDAAAVHSQLSAKRAALQGQIRTVIARQAAAVRPVPPPAVPTPVPPADGVPAMEAAPAPPEQQADEAMNGIDALLRNIMQPPPESVPAPSPEPVPGESAGPQPASASGDGPGAVAVRAALSQIGSRYTWGGETPGSFDCSGLVKWAYAQTGVSMPHSSQAQAGLGRAVSMSDLQPGDLVTFYSDASHVGMYVGDGNVIHAPTYGQPVKVVPLNSAGPVHNVRRPG